MLSLWSLAGFSIVVVVGFFLRKQTKTTTKNQTSAMLYIVVITFLDYFLVCNFNILLSLTRSGLLSLLSSSEDSSYS